MGVSCGSFLRRTCDHFVDRCCRLFPCLSDPARRAALLLKITFVILHLVIAGVLFLFDHDLVEKSKEEPWYTAMYVLLFVATLLQYFVTAGTSPGYVLDAKKAVDERDASARMTLLTSNKDNQHQAKMVMLQLPWMEGTTIEEMRLLGQS